MIERCTRSAAVHRCFRDTEDDRGSARTGDAEHAKVLVRDNPGLDPARREQQATRLGEVSAWAARAGRSLILELLVPAIDADKDATEGDIDRYDDELRPRHTLQVMEYLQGYGVEPALWTPNGVRISYRLSRPASVSCTLPPFHWLVTSLAGLSWSREKRCSRPW